MRKLLTVLSLTFLFPVLSQADGTRPICKSEVFAERSYVISWETASAVTYTVQSVLKRGPLKLVGALIRFHEKSIAIVQFDSVNTEEANAEADLLAEIPGVSVECSTKYGPF